MSLKSLRQCVDYADGLATVAAAHAVISQHCAPGDRPGSGRCGAPDVWRPNTC